MSRFNAQLKIGGNLYDVILDGRTITDIKAVYNPAGQGMAGQGQPQAGQGRGIGGNDTANPPIFKEPEIKIDDVFKAKLSSILTDNAYNRRIGNRKRGNLDMKRLWRAPTGNTSLFTQKLARKGKHYNVALVLDVSGSMTGRPLETASELCVWLAKHFEALDIDFSVITFASSAEVVKPINKDSQSLHADIHKSMRSVGGGTDIPAGLELAYKQLKNLDGQSFIIGISDGETSRPEVAKAMLHANPDIRAFGVGIGTPLRVMPENEVVNDIDQLKPVIISWLQHNVKRGF